MRLIFNLLHWFLSTTTFKINGLLLLKHQQQKKIRTEIITGEEGKFIARKITQNLLTSVTGFFLRRLNGALPEFSILCKESGKKYYTRRREGKVTGNFTYKNSKKKRNKGTKTQDNGKSRRERKKVNLATKARRRLRRKGRAKEDRWGHTLEVRKWRGVMEG